MRRVFGYAFLFLGAAVLLSLGFSDGSRAADGAKIAVAYSGNMLGYLEPCG